MTIFHKNGTSIERGKDACYNITVYAMVIISNILLFYIKKSGAVIMHGRKTAYIYRAAPGNGEKMKRFIKRAAAAGLAVAAALSLLPLSALGAWSVTSRETEYVSNALTYTKTGFTTSGNSQAGYCMEFTPGEDIGPRCLTAPPFMADRR